MRKRKFVFKCRPSLIIDCNCSTMVAIKAAIIKTTTTEKSKLNEVKPAYNFIFIQWKQLYSINFTYWMIFWTKKKTLEMLKMCFTIWMKCLKMSPWFMWRRRQFPKIPFSREIIHLYKFFLLITLVRAFKCFVHKW